MTRTFIETPIFTRNWRELNLDDDSLAELQKILLDNPKAGVSVAGTGGMRKIRVPCNGHGSSGFDSYFKGGRVDMKDVFTDTITGLMQAVSIEKGNINVEKVANMPAETYRSMDSNNADETSYSMVVPNKEKNL